jgi:hypothetical protein
LGRRVGNNPSRVRISYPPPPLGGTAGPGQAWAAQAVSTRRAVMTGSRNTRRPDWRFGGRRPWRAARASVSCWAWRCRSATRACIRSWLMIGFIMVSSVSAGRIWSGCLIPVAPAGWYRGWFPRSPVTTALTTRDHPQDNPQDRGPVAGPLVSGSGFQTPDRAQLVAKAEPGCVTGASSGGPGCLLLGGRIARQWQAAWGDAGTWPRIAG